MLTAFQHSQACSCHLPLSLQSLPLQPSCSQQSRLFPPRRDQGRGGLCSPRWGQAQGLAVPRAPAGEIDGLGGEGSPHTSFHCFLMGSPSKPMAGSSSVFTGSHLVTFLGSINMPHCGLTGFGGLQTANPSALMTALFICHTEVPLGKSLLLIKHSNTSCILCTTDLHVSMLNP